MITEQQCGLVIPPDNAEAFADALEQAATQRDLLKIMGANARRLAETQFDRAYLSIQFVNWLEGAHKT
jgi:glycosyltransferase involved in cell wall biosynthesis